MKVPIKVWITLAIIAGSGIGTGSLVGGILAGRQDERTTMIASGATLLVISAASLIAHLAGGFRDLSLRLSCHSCGDSFLEVVLVTQLLDQNSRAASWTALSNSSHADWAPFRTSFQASALD
jgi:hypothetical protein